MTKQHLTTDNTEGYPAVDLETYNKRIDRALKAMGYDPDDGETSDYKNVVERVLKDAEVRRYYMVEEFIGAKWKQRSHGVFDTWQEAFAMVEAASDYTRWERLRLVDNSELVRCEVEAIGQAGLYVVAMAHEHGEPDLRRYLSVWSNVDFEECAIDMVDGLNLHTNHWIGPDETRTFAEWLHGQIEHREASHAC